MKRLLIIIDGMDDEPAIALGGKTPKEIASMPGLEFMRNNGVSRMLSTIPEGNIPSSETAILNILGNHVMPDFSGRTWLEALGAGVKVAPEDLCIRCNLISVEDNRILSHCGVGICDEDASRIIDLLNLNFSNGKLRFYHGNGFRNLLIVKNCSSDFKVTPVHELVGSDVAELSVRSEDKQLKDMLNGIISRSRQILASYCAGANAIALWASGHSPAMQFVSRSGAVVAGINLVKGIGKACGMDVIDVAGATGDYHTDYSGKYIAALKALEKYDFVMLHVEAADEASHQRDAQQKIKILEDVDRFILSPLLKCGFDMEITVQSDHATSSASGQHLDSPVEVITYFNKNT